MYKSSIAGIYVYVMLLVLSVSCGTEATDRINSIPVDIDRTTVEYMNYSEYVDSISYIRLHGMGEKPLANVDNIKFADSVIVAFDGESQRVMVFDEGGRYLHDIGSRGQGHGEFGRCLQIDLDRERRNVLLYDIMKGAALRYDYEGRFLGLDSLGVADDIAYLGNGKYLLANYNEGNDDRAGIFQVTVDPYSIRKLRGCRDKIAMNKPSEFFDCDCTPGIMTRSYEDEVLQWDGDSLVSLVKFDIVQNPAEGQKREIVDNPSKRMDFVNRIGFYNYKDLLMIYFSYFNSHKASPGYLLYDKSTRKAEMVKGFKNDIDGISGWWLPLSRNNSIVTAVMPDDGSDPQIQFLHLKASHGVAENSCKQNIPL